MRRPDEPPRLAHDGEPIAQFVHLSAFAERMLVHENALVRIRPRRPARPRGADRLRRHDGPRRRLQHARACAAGRDAPSSSAAAASASGRSRAAASRAPGRIIAVDTAAWKLDLARRLGATDVGRRRRREPGRRRRRDDRRAASTTPSRRSALPATVAPGGSHDAEGRHDRHDRRRCRRARTSSCPARTSCCARRRSSAA